jgi:hypothetical protein
MLTQVFYQTPHAYQSLIENIIGLLMSVRKRENSIFREAFDAEYTNFFYPNWVGL